jgi:L-galactose dehydrogenase
MQSAELGRSGIVTSIVGLGGGGPSRFGLSTGSRPAEAIALIRRARDLGVTFFDGSGLIGGVDEVLGEAVKPFRRDVVLSSKVNLAPAIWPLDRNRTLHRAAARAAGALSLVASSAAIRAHVERTLRQLATDTIDILHLHAVAPGQFDDAVKKAVPVLEALKREGKVRAIGVTELFSRDPNHKMLARAVDAGFADVVMTGLNLLNASARDAVIPAATAREIGVIAMFAVGRVLTSEAGLAAALSTPDAAERAASFMRTLRENGVERLTDAAYRFCRHERGVAVTLIGTGNIVHLEENIAAAAAPPLPPSVVQAIRALAADQSATFGGAGAGRTSKR